MIDAVTEVIPPDRLSGPGEIWVCAACSRTHVGDRYDMGDTACVLHAVRCEAQKGCKCVEPCPEPHWVQVKFSDSSEHAST